METTHPQLPREGIDADVGVDMPIDIVERIIGDPGVVGLGGVFQVGSFLLWVNFAVLYLCFVTYG